MRDQYFYLEFDIGSQRRFDALARFFAALKVEKDKLIKSWDSDAAEDAYDPDGEPEWSDFLDEEAAAWFANILETDSEEYQTYHALWKLTEPEVRSTHPMFRLPGNWDFETMLDSIFEREYVLVELVQQSATQGVLYFDPWAGPFGGTECLVALLKSFGNTVTFDSWNKGIPQRRESGWNYELAKKLVAAGKGFVP